jgi:SAM-dependent methyltransferase
MDPKLMHLCGVHVPAHQVRGRKIIDVGSYDVNGSFRTVLEPLSPKCYIGTDMAAGPGVDRVVNVDDLVDTFGSNCFDIVISTEAIEHIQDWRTAINQIKRVCKIGGMVVLTSRSRGFGFHAYPHDHWRFEYEDVVEIFEGWQIEVLEEDMFNNDHYGFFMKAWKLNDNLTDLSGMSLYNIHTDRRMYLDQNPSVPGMPDLVIMRRIRDESELSEAEKNPPVKYW